MPFLLVLKINNAHVPDGGIKICVATMNLLWFKSLFLLLTYIQSI